MDRSSACAVLRLPRRLDPDWRNYAGTRRRRTNDDHEPYA